MDPAPDPEPTPEELAIYAQRKAEVDAERLRNPKQPNCNRRKYKRLPKIINTPGRKRWNGRDYLR